MSDTLTALHDTVGQLFRRQLFFIGGAARSGTTWLQLMLDAHPSISCRGEGHFCSSLLPQLDNALSRHNVLVNTKNATIFKGLNPYPTFTRSHGQYLLAAAMTLLMAECAGDAPIVGEKTPDNVLVVPQLHVLFPTARFVILVRDGRDCAVSAWFHNQRFEAATIQERFPRFVDFVDAFAQGWAVCVDSGLRAIAAYPQHCLSVSYEALMHTPETTLARLLGFLGADPDAALVGQCIAAAAFTRLAGGRERGQEDRQSLFRRGEIGDWRHHFDAACCDAFERHAGAQLRRCGYQGTTLEAAN